VNYDDGRTGWEIVDEYETYMQKLNAENVSREDAGKRAGKATRFTPLGDGMDDPNPTRSRTFILGADAQCPPRCSRHGCASVAPGSWAARPG
jgi:hypothetical protein